MVTIVIILSVLTTTCSVVDDVNQLAPLLDVVKHIILRGDVAQEVAVKLSALLNAVVEGHAGLGMQEIEACGLGAALQVRLHCACGAMSPSSSIGSQGCSVAI